MLLVPGDDHNHGFGTCEELDLPS